MTKYVYLDESGDLGFGQPKASHYLVIAFIATSLKDTLKRVVRKEKVRMGLTGTDEVKGDTLSAANRAKFLSRLLNVSDLEIHSVIIDKDNVAPHLQPSGMQNVLYAYAAGLILFPCLRKSDDVHIIADSRSVKTRFGYFLPDYLKLQLNIKYGSLNRFDFRSLDSIASLGLQAAHVVTNTIWRKYEKGYAGAYPLIKPRMVDEFRPFKNSGVAPGNG